MGEKKLIMNQINNRVSIRTYELSALDLTEWSEEEILFEVKKQFSLFSSSLEY